MKPYKAYIAFALTFISSLLALVQDKTKFSDLTPFQWVVAILSATVVAGGVYVTDNRPGAYKRG